MVRLGHSQVFLLGCFSYFGKCRSVSRGGSVNMNLLVFRYPAWHLLSSVIYGAGLFCSLWRPYCGQVCSYSLRASDDALIYQC